MATAPESPEPSASWMLKATIVFASVPVALAFSIPTPVLPRMAEHFGQDPMTEYLVRMVLGVLGIAMALGAPLAGYLADRIGRRPVLVGSGVLLAVAGVVPAMADSLYVILSTRLLVGMAAAAFATSGAALVGDHFREAERARWMGMLLAGSLIGGVVATPVSGLIGDYGWRWPFLLYLFGLPIALLAFLGLRQPAGDQGRTALEEKIDRQAAAGGRFPFGIVLLALIVGVLMYVPGVYAPFRLRDLGVDNPSTVAIGVTLNAVVGAVFAVQFGRARASFSSLALFAWSFGATALGVLILAMAPTYQWAFVGLFVIGAGSVWLYPNMLEQVISAVHERRRAQAIGWLRSAQSLSPAIGLTLFEPLVAEFGVHVALLVIAGLSVLLFAGAIARHLRKGADAAKPADFH